MTTPRPDLATDVRPSRVNVPWRVIGAVAVGGLVGAIGRYAVASALPAADGGFPWGTFVINVTGAAMLGLLLILITELLPDDHLARPLAGTGIIGAYTTFSTYMIDADLLIRGHHYGTAAAYVLASFGAGMAAIWAGVGVARGILHVRQGVGEELDVLSRDPEVR